jgi:HK97 family phage portal protein
LRLFGFDIVRKKVAAPPVLTPVTTTATTSPLGWFGPIRESFTGAWQRDITTDPPTSILAFSAVYCCVTGIAGDISKNRIKVVRNVKGVWEEITENNPWLPVLRKPNHYQSRIQFVEQWIISKLLWGNTYVLKERDARGIVNGLHILSPQRVIPMVADNGEIFYELHQDYLTGLPEPIVIPAREIIHDTMACLWHPLVGVPPIYACAISATMGNKIQGNSTTFFGNLSLPGGMLSAPGHISDETVIRLKATWQSNFGGANIGKIAVAGDGLKFETFSMPAEQAQLIDQLKWTVDDVARAFHYPLFKMGGPVPPYSAGPEAVSMMYFTDCLQILIEALEISLDNGLELPLDQGTEMDIDNLVRMDTQALYDSNAKAVGGGWMSPNEARYRANFGPVTGGDSPMIQQQNFSLEALAKRDAQLDPFAKATTQPPAEEPPEDEEEEDEDEFEEEEEDEDDEEEDTETRRIMTVADLEFFETEYIGELIQKC